MVSGVIIEGGIYKSSFCCEHCYILEIKAIYLLLFDLKNYYENKLSQNHRI